MSAGPGLRFLWERALRDDTELTLTHKAVAYTLATYADTTTGRKAFPGTLRLARGAALSRRSVLSATKALREAGWIEETRPALRAGGGAAEFRLTIPTGARGAPSAGGAPSQGQPLGAPEGTEVVQEVHPTDTGTPYGSAPQERSSTAAAAERQEDPPRRGLRRASDFAEREERPAPTPMVDTLAELDRRCTVTGGHYVPRENFEVAGGPGVGCYGARKGELIPHYIVQALSPS